MLRLDAFTRRAQAPLYARVPCKASQVTKLFQVRVLLKALPYCRAGSSPIPLGNCIYILDKGIVKSIIV
jgi:hypothetical protein